MMNIFKNYLGMAFLWGLVSMSVACAASADDTWNDVREAAASTLESGYIYEAKGEELANFLRNNGARYKAIKDPEEFARKLTLDLFEIANDKHLRITFKPNSAEEIVVDEGETDVQPKIQYCQTAPLTFHMEGRVGVLQFPRFFGGDDYITKIDDAMKSATEASAMILDLRNNCGGGPKIVRHLSTYFFDKRTHLVSTEMRGSSTSERWTFDEVPGPRFVGKPLYILINGNTFSAAESFTFGMKTTGRAMTVGENSGGGGHFGEESRLTSDFIMFLPVGRTFDPRTGTGWEAEGISPDITVVSDKALDAALTEIKAE